LEDAVEVANGLNPLVSSDATADLDGDGLNNRDEITVHQTDPRFADTDHDAIPDGWEVARGLDPRVSDAQEDPDVDGFTNLQESLLNSSPLNPLDPPRGVYVSPQGSDTSGKGSEEAPWFSITKAMLTASAYASEWHAVTIYAAPGNYDELVEFVPHITLKGAGSSATFLQHFNRADSQHFVVLAAENTKLEDCTVTLPGLNADVTVLVNIDDVSMEMSNVVLDGQFCPFSVGIQVGGNGSSAGSIHDCRIVNLNDGIWAVNSGISLARNVFDTLFRFGVFIIPPSGKALENPDVPVLGRRETMLSSGLNRFYNVQSTFIFNGSTVQIQERGG
jgi:hypothetical protein